MRRKKMDRRYRKTAYHGRGKRYRQILTILVLVLAVSGAIFLTYAKKEGPAVPETGQVSDGDTGDVMEPVEPVEEEPSRGEKPEVPAVDDGLDAQTDQTEKGTDDPGDADQAGEASAVDCNVLVPASEAVDLSYFDDAVFIGDSRTEGLFINTGLSNATFYTHQGMTVSEVFTREVINAGGKKTTVMDALAGASFSKVYIMLGMNELGWVYESVFKEDYGKIIDKIREINPDAKIYIQSIIPVSKWKDSNDTTYTIYNVDRLNTQLRALADEKEVHYVDVAEGLMDEEGYLPYEATLDGVHLVPEYCVKWLDYLKTHTAQ